MSVLTRKLLLLIPMLIIGTTSQASIIPIGKTSMSADMEEITFEEFNTGELDLLMLSSYQFVNNIKVLGSVQGDDIWNSGYDGKGVAANENGELIVLDYGDDFTALSVGSSFAFELSQDAFEFGFKTVDQNNNYMTLQTFKDGNLLEQFSFRSTGPLPRPIMYFKADQAFDEFRIRSDQNVGFGVDNVIVGGAVNNDSTSTEVSVPEPSTVILLLISLLGFGRIHSRFRG